MAFHSPPAPRPLRGLPDKRRAIMGAARKLFGRDGYTRTSVDGIAGEAGVSKRTIYNHFANKEELFQSVVLEGAEDFTRTVAAIADRHLRKIVDIEDDLVEFGVDRARAAMAAEKHFSLVRTIKAEATRIPRPLLEAWREVGPSAAQGLLAGYLRQLTEKGFLHVTDAAKAANHFTLLTFANVADSSFNGAVPLPDAEIEEIVTSGVRTFLRLYGAPPRG
ncbi:TetR/AcrR family transcriptional regulator [Streptomyces roseirectus]|uniref:TetR/AcrR family transcriptional regulator n=1 Tax=Streptomyces roseirectus TaxID=2768066 RepID=A0A7H0ICB7_9ACTN|nr:TetR/AcrR family transcriptional regulator [Streptomyces roseirectus]QNP70433.1 TetR/AcrR family transcriptional regulator [Streptomyces roseirectus]